jgi:glucose-1-phosphate cytidylyltransferase
MKALILCGGLGTRYNLDNSTKILKPLLKVDGISILERIINLYIKQGVDEFILLGGFKYNKLKKFSKKFKNLKIKTINTGLKTNTAGRLLKVRHLIDKNENFLFTYGDSIADLNLKKIIYNKKPNNYIMSKFYYKIPYGALKLTSDSLLKKFIEKKAIVPINAGFYILDGSIFSYIKNYQESFEKTTINKIIRKKKKNFKCIGLKNWFPLDTRHDQFLLDRYLKKNTHL